ncbi:MAG: xanthine dehydrogenase family protein subunit M [Elusimicrobia bacterium]|nr:xanthine dehydrogenase family protein subunit M [Elusimicrobiota bacterium]
MKFLKAHTPDEAVRLFGQHPEAIPLAGATDAMVAWNVGRLNGKIILDLSAIDEWKTIQILRNSLKIGSLVTHAEIQRHPVIRKKFSLLAQASSQIGSTQVQNRGTIGGNIANASPAGDTFPPLAVYNALIHTVSFRGPRVLAFLDVFAWVKKTRLHPSELIEAVEIPYPSPVPKRWMFRKVGTRSAMIISKTVAAGLLWMNKDATVNKLRFALGSVAPTVKRLKTAEAFVAGKRLTPDVVEHACRIMADDISPIDDIRSTAEYRLQVSQNLLRSFLKF